MKIRFLIFLSLLSLKSIGSTPQIPDKLIYNGCEYNWNGYSPALDFLNELNFKPPYEAIVSSANYEIFLFEYSIIENCLYLTDIEILVSIKKEGPPELKHKSIFKDCFPNINKILMRNYSDLRIISYGEQEKALINGRTTFNFEHYLVFDFKEGIIEKQYDFGPAEFQNLKNEQFQKFKKTNNYKIQIANYKLNLKHYNELRSEKYSMDEYLEMNILDIIKHLQ